MRRFTIKLELIIFAFVLIVPLLLGSILSPASFAQSARNPYAETLNVRLTMLPPIPSYNDRTLSDDETYAWYFRTVAEDLLIRTWGITDPRSTLTQAHRNIFAQHVKQEVEYLLRMNHDGRWWWSGSGRTGDANTDRFVLYSLLDALFRLKDHEQFQELIKSWLEQLRPAVEFQYNQYGQKTPFDWATQVAGQYPNMDAAYVLIMGLAGQLYDETKYADSAREFIHSLEDHLFPHGAFNYHTATNEVLAYHDIVVTLIGRYWHVTGDERARELLVNTVDYYPLTLGRLGVPESTSHAWWKNSRASTNPAPIEIIASLTGDGRNKWIANRFQSFVWPIFAYHASAFFRDDIVPVDPGDDMIVEDKNIGGVRGRFGEFSWVGSLGAVQEAFAGAIVVDSETNPPRANGMLLSVTPEVGLSLVGSLISRTAFVTGLSYPKSLIITDDVATMSVQYIPERYTGGSSTVPTEMEWQVTQTWLFLPTHIVGRVHMQPVEEHHGKFVRARIKTIPDDNLEQQSESSFKTGRLHINLLENDFPIVRTGRGEAQDYYSSALSNVDEIFLEEPPLTDRPWRLYSADTSYSVALESYPESEQPTQHFQSVNGDGYLGFGVSVDSTRYITLFNITDEEIDVTYELSSLDLTSDGGTARVTVRRENCSCPLIIEDDFSEGSTINVGTLSPHKSALITLTQKGVVSP